MNESYVSHAARSPSRPSRGTSRLQRKKGPSRQQNVSQPPRRLSKPNRTYSTIQVDPQIYLPAFPAYQPKSQPTPILQQKSQINQPSNLSLNPHVQSQTKIFSKQIDSGGSISFLLRIVNPHLDLSSPGIIEVPAEAILDHVTWEDLQDFEHNEFEKDFAEKEYERQKKCERREKAKLMRNGAKRGRGRPKKIIGGDTALAADKVVMGGVVPDSEAVSSETESEDTLSESDDSSVPASTAIASKKQDDRRHAHFKIEIPSPRSKIDQTVPIPRSILDRGKVKIRSEASQGIRKPKSRSQAKLVANASVSQSLGEPKNKRQAEPVVNASEESSAVIDLTSSADELGAPNPPVARKMVSKIPIRLPAKKFRPMITHNHNKTKDNGALLRQFQDQISASPHLQTQRFSDDVKMTDSRTQRPETADKISSESQFNSDSDSDSERVDLLRQSQQPLPAKRAAQKPPTAKPVISTAPRAFSVPGKNRNSIPSTYPPQHQNKLTKPVLHYDSSDSDYGDLLRKFQQPLSQKPVAQKTLAPKLVVSNLPPASSVPDKQKDSKPSLYPPQYQKPPAKPVLHYNSSDSDYGDLLRKFQQPLSQKPVAQKTAAPIPIVSNLPPASSVPGKLKDSRPSLYPPQYKKPPPKPVLHYNSSDDEDDDGDKSSKAELFLQKFQPKTFPKKPLPTQQPKLFSGDTDHGNNASEGELLQKFQPKTFPKKPLPTQQPKLSSDDTDHDNNGSKGALLLQKFQPKTFPKKPLPTQQPKLSSDDTDHDNNGSKGELLLQKLQLKPVPKKPLPTQPSPSTNASKADVILQTFQPKTLPQNPPPTQPNPPPPPPRPRTPRKTHIYDYFPPTPSPARPNASARASMTSQFPTQPAAAPLKRRRAAVPAQESDADFVPSGNAGRAKQKKRRVGKA